MSSRYPTIDPDSPYALRHLEEMERRRTMLTLPHMVPLIAYAQQIRAQLGSGYDIPHFDPCDGGINARVLFLLKAPGRKAVGSGFISRNNPDPSAKNLGSLLSQVGLPRNVTLIWNIVPWYIGDAQHIRDVTKADIATALPFVSGLIGLLPRLMAIVLLGGRAQSVKSQLALLTHARFFDTYNPGLQAMNREPGRRDRVLETFEGLVDFLNRGA
jgi:uracil-DNA glycosylase